MKRIFFLSVVFSLLFYLSAYAGPCDEANCVNVTGDTMTGALNIDTAADVDALNVNVTGTSRAGRFKINNALNSKVALLAETNGKGHAFYSSTSGKGRAGHFQIFNASNTSPALYALTNGTGSAISASTTGNGNGVDGHAGGSGHGVYGTTSGSGNAVYGYSTGTGRAGYFRIFNTSNAEPALKAETNGTGRSGYFSGGAGVYINGNLNVTGTLTKGSGSFVQPYRKDPSKEIAYAFFEGPEHAIFLRGKAKLIDGRAVIETPEHFRDVAGKDEDITVQFTPRYKDTFGVAAVEVTKDRIVVEELKGENHSYEFDYFITAKRAGFEEHAPIQPNTHFTAENTTREEFEKTYSRTDNMTIRVMRELLISNGILTPDGRLNLDVAQRLGWKVKDVELAAK